MTRLHIQIGSDSIHTDSRTMDRLMLILAVLGCNDPSVGKMHRRPQENGSCGAFWDTSRNSMYFVSDILKPESEAFARETASKLKAAGVDAFVE